MRVEYYTPVDSSLLFSLLDLEVVLTFINMLIYVPVIYVIQTAPFHQNLKFLMTLIVTYYYCGMTARLLTVLAIIGSVNLDWTNGTGNNIMIGASYVRMFFFAIVSFSRLATIFLEDYERKLRPYVALLVSIYMTTGSLICAFLVVYEQISWIILLVITVVQSIFFPFRFWALERFNKKTLKELSKGKSHGRYSLSVRYQLDENIRIMRLMKYVFLMIIVVNVFSCGVFLAANLPTIRQGNPLDWQILDTLFNIIVNLDGYLVPLTILYVDENFKKLLKDSPYLFWVVFWYSPRSDVFATEDHGKIYFSTLQFQWEHIQSVSPPPQKFMTSVFKKKDCHVDCSTKSK